MDTPRESNPSDPETIRRNMAHALAAIVYSALPGATPRAGSLRLDFVNRYAAEYFGVAPEDVAANRWLDLVHPDDRAGVEAAWAASLATGQHYRHEHRFLMRDGVYRRFHAEALPLRDESGAILKWYGVLTPLDGPRLRGPRPRPATVDIYPLRDACGQLQLVEVAVWDARPDDPAAKLHPCGAWYRIEPVEG
jgi:PAS domain S-box-containing protein